MKSCVIVFIGFCVTPFLKNAIIWVHWTTLNREKRAWLNEEARSKDLAEGLICSTFFIDCVHCHAIKNKKIKNFALFLILKTPKMAKNHEISAYFSTNVISSFMSRTTITSKIILHWFPNEGRY